MRTIAIIGLGNMGGAILRGVVRAGYAAQSQIYAYDSDPDKVARIHADLPEVHTTACARDAAAPASLVIPAVKPVYLGGLLDELGDTLRGKAVLSIAAGWTVAQLAAVLQPLGATWLRVMPNTPAMVGEGMTAVCEETSFSPEDQEYAKGIFNALGRTVTVPERLLDGATAISGSSPAYFFMMLEAMGDAGVREGLPRSTAYEMAAQTMLGSALMALRSGSHPGELKDAVCSPGGTTIEAVAELEAAGFRSAVMRGMKACADKSREMSKR